MQENSYVHLPKGVDEKTENEIGILRELVLGEFTKYKNEIEKNEIRDGIREEKRRNQEGSNLTAQEKRGLKKLKTRIKDNELIVLKTDKSGKLTLIKREQYLKIGENMNKQDRMITRKELKDIERDINNHTRVWAKILNAGESHGHLKRITNSKITNSESVASKYYMFKDHKKEGV